MPKVQHALTNFDHFRTTVLDVAGEAGLFAVIKARAGRQVYIPTAQPIRGDHWLATTLGINPAREICRRLRILDADDRPIPFARVIIPLSIHGLRARANARVQQLLLEGKTTDEIAREAGVHVRTVFRRRARLVNLGKLDRNRKPRLGRPGDHR